MLFVFAFHLISYPTFCHLVLHSFLLPLLFLYLLHFLFNLTQPPPPPPLPPPPPCPLSFLSFIFSCSLTLLFPSYSTCLWFWEVFTKHIGTGCWWMGLPWLHTCTNRHTCLCVHTETCWRWWLMSNARLSASKPIKAAQETSLGLLATARHWLPYLPACLFHCGRNLKSSGITLLNTHNPMK